MLRNGIKKNLKLSIIFVCLCVSMLFALAFTEFAYAEEETSNDMEKEEERSEEEDAECIKEEEGIENPEPEEEDTEKQEKDLEEEKEEPSEGDDVYNVPLDEGDKEKDNKGSKEVNQEQFKGEAMTHEMAPALKGIPEPKLTLYQSGGKWYIRDESTGQNLKGQWATIEDKKYYASDNEYLWQSRTINMAGKNYYVGDDCSVQYGVVYAKNNGNYYYADQSNGGAFVKGQWIDHNGKKYYASDSEPLHRSRTINMAGKNYYVGDDCSVQYGVVYAKNNGNYYYADEASDGAFVKGQWVDYNGKKYYASDSEPLHRNRTINMAEKNYYVGDDCSVVMGKVVYDKNRDKYYYGDPSTGVYVKGQWVDYNDKKYYASDSEPLHRNRTINMDGKNYYVGDDCSVVKGKVVYDKNRDKYYYGDPSTGVYVKGQWVDYNGKKYYASDSEPLHRNRTINMDKKDYYVGDDCSVQSGFVGAADGKKAYYADPANNNALKSWDAGWHVIDGKKYYMAGGYTIKAGVFQVGDKYYYGDPKLGGAIAVGKWCYEDGKMYYASDNEYLHQNRMINSGGHNYYAGPTCAMESGWHEYKNEMRYYDPQTLWSVSDVVVEGYYINAKGIRTNAAVLAKQTLDKIGWDLLEAYKYIRDLPFVRFSKDNLSKGTTWLAEYLFKQKKGSCMYKASAFWYMARTLGYSDMTILRGSVTAYRYAHTWNEMEVDGVKYIFDPVKDDNAHSSVRGRVSSYWVPYKTPGTWKYNDDYYVMPL